MGDLDDYRRQVRAWLQGNLERKDPDAGPEALRGSHDRVVATLPQQRQLQRRVYEGGYAGITWPREYGGQGLTAAHQRVFDEESAHFVMPDFGIAGGTTTVVCGPTLLVHATESFKHEHIPRILAGDELWVQFFSEPGAGSDLAAVLTRADRRDGGWALNGQKTWTSGGQVADYGLCLARTNWEVPKHRGLTWFAVSTSAPGVTIRPIREINGATEFCEEFLDDVVVADEDVIGDVDDGWTVTRTMLAVERMGGNPEARSRRLGPRELASDLVALARKVGREGDSHTRQMVARAHVNDWVQEELESRVLALAQRDPRAAELASLSKLAAGVYDPLRARLGLEIGGSAAVAWVDSDPDGARAAVDYLNGRILSIAGGTNEMQRNTIAERLLGLPREPAYDADKPFSQVLREARNWSGR